MAKGLAIFLTEECNVTCDMTIVQKVVLLICGGLGPMKSFIYRSWSRPSLALVNKIEK